MVQRRNLIWQFSAQNDRKDIFKYWNIRNKSNLYSKKLNKIFEKRTELLIEFPHSGYLTNIPNTRVLVVENYLIVYEVLDNEISILRIFDGRRNPENMEI